MKKLVLLSINLVIFTALLSKVSFADCCLACSGNVCTDVRGSGCAQILFDGTCNNCNATAPDQACAGQWTATGSPACGGYNTCSFSPDGACTGNCPSGGGPPPVPANSPIGYHDIADCTGVFGWSCDADNYAQDLTINIYSDGVLVGTDIAGDAGEPAIGGLCGGDSNKRFNWPLPMSLRDGVTHSIRTEAVNIGSGSNTNLNGTPRSITCACPLPTTAPTNVNVTLAPNSCAVNPNNLTFNMTWTAVAGATAYNIRVDNMTNPWSGNCAAMNAGDFCIDGLSGTSYTISNRNLAAGTQYRIWMDATNSCGSRTSGSQFYTFFCPRSLSGQLGLSDGTPSCNISPVTLTSTGTVQASSTTPAFSPTTTVNTNGTYSFSNTLQFPTQAPHMNLTLSNINFSDTNFTYALSCSNVSSGVSGLSLTGISLTGVNTPSTVNFGFTRYLREGWFQTIGGDVFTGVGFNTWVQNNATYDATSYLIDGTPAIEKGHGLLLSRGVVDVDKPGDTATDWSSQGTNKYVVTSYTPATASALNFPSNITFTPPSYATPVTTTTNPIRCSNFFNTSTGAFEATTYTMDAACFLTAITPPNYVPTYNFRQSGGVTGATVIYVNGDLTINRTLSGAASDAMTIIVNGTATLASNMGSPTGFAQSAIPSMGNYTLVARAINMPSNGTQNDTILSLYGSMISQNGITLGRNGSLRDNNAMPVHIFNYVPRNIVYMNRTEMASTNPNYTGLYVSDIKWEVK